MSCLDEEEVLDLLDGALPSPRRQALEHHIAGCATCRALVSATVRLEASPASEDYQLGDDIGPGTRIEHFQVMRPLGTGRTGQVYLCRDTRLGRRVALKVVRPEAIGSPAAVERFLVEARTTARFNHPHIVTIHAAGVWRGLPYLALEYLEGQTLRQRMDQERLGRGQVIRVALALAQALEAAHGSGVVHGDLKPANVILARDGSARVVDFGLARAVSAGDTIERDGRPVAGTPAYMAPEQWAGRSLSAAADVWALGVVLFELLHGQRPFKAGSLVELRRLVTSPETGLPPAHEVEGVLGELIDGCLGRDPGQRPSAAQVQARLEGLLRPEGVGAALESEGGGPFRGLLPFGEEHAAAFVGREVEVAAFMELLRDHGVLTVVGPSGAGKTSFVQAGVLPMLREQADWLVLRLQPGAEPFKTLAARLVRAPGTLGTLEGEEGGEAALAETLRQAPTRLNLLLRRLAQSSGRRLLLLVDQLEELCTQGVARETQRAFLSALANAGDDPQDPVRVVSTLRDDFLGRLAVDPAAREPLGRVTVLHSPEPEALRRMVSEPLSRSGYTYDREDLPQIMVDEVRGEVTALPLLGFTTRLLWERRDPARRLLLESVYREVGGVAGALARHADSVLEALPPDQMRLAGTLLLRLVTGSGARQVRRGADLLSGLPPEPAAAALDRLVSGRLVSVRRVPGEEELEAAGEVAYELAHESLLRSWDRLARWISGSRQELRLLRQLTQAAELWDRRGQRGEELWQGEALAEAARVLDNGVLAIPEEVELFLARAVAREQSRRRGRRLRLAVAAVVLTAVAVASSLVAFTLSRQKRQAVTQRAEAQLQGARSALARGDPLEARALLRASLESRDSSQARVLWWRLGRQPLLWSRDLGEPLWALAMSPDGQVVAAGGAGRVIHLLDAETRQPLGTPLRGHTDQVLSLAFSPDGKRLASGSWNGEVLLWDRQGSPKGRLLPERHDGAVWDVAFSPDGKRLASGSYDKTVRLWDLFRAGGPRMERLISGHDSGVYAVAFSPDGKLLASGSYDHTVRLHPLEGGGEARVLKGHSSGVYAVAFSPDGGRLASASADATVRLWQVDGAVQEGLLSGFSDTVDSLAFSPDGATLACGSYDRTVRLFEPGSGRLLGTLSGHTGAVVGLAFSPDGATLASASRDESLRLWRVAAAGLDPPSAGHTASVWSVAFSPDGKLLASGSRDGTVRLWAVEDGQQRKVLGGHPDGVLALSFSPDGKLLASAGADHKVRLWETHTGRSRRLLSGHSGEVFAVAFSPDGALLASAGYDKSVRLWDVKSGREQRRLAGHKASVYGLAFSPDGALLASSSYDKTVRLWDMSNGETPARILAGHTDTVYGVSFSPDGKLLASGGADRTVRVWTVAGGQGRVLATLPKRVYWLAFHPDGKQVGVPSADGVARLLPLSGGAPRLLKGHRGEVNVLRFSRDGALAATGSDDGTVRMWDVASAKPAWGPGRTTSAPAAPAAVAGQLEATLRALPASSLVARAQAPMDTVALGFENGLVGLWDQITGQRLMASRLHGPILGFTLKDTALHATSELGQRLVWDLEVLGTEHCRLLREVWGEVRVAWDKGRVVRKPQPNRHPCR